MVVPRQGEVWWYEVEDKRRPVLVVTRDVALPVLRRVVVAPITRTIRGIPTEIHLSPEEGLPEECVATFDNLRPALRAHLTDLIGSLGPRRLEICRALAALANC